MFGDMMGMMNQLKDTQQRVEAKKKELDTVILDEVSSSKDIKVQISANRRIIEIQISDALLEDKEQLEDYLVSTLNKAIEKAHNYNEQELAKVAKTGLPDIPGMNF